MGLDMELRVKKRFMKDQPTDIDTGLKIHAQILNLHYWRKHPNLHGYIVETFADSDNCEPIELYGLQIVNIIEAIKNDKLPHTEGFFFGTSEKTKEQKEQDLYVFKKALEMIKKTDENYLYSIIYQASW